MITDCWHSLNKYTLHYRDSDHPERVAARTADLPLISGLSMENFDLNGSVIRVRFRSRRYESFYHIGRDARNILRTSSSISWVFLFSWAWKIWWGFSGLKNSELEFFPDISSPYVRAPANISYLINRLRHSHMVAYHLSVSIVAIAKLRSPVIVFRDFFFIIQEHRCFSPSFAEPVKRHL